jgi:hypothetical protein
LAVVVEQVELWEDSADGFAQAVLGGDEGGAGRTGLGRRGKVGWRQVDGAVRGMERRRVGRVEPGLAGGGEGVAGLTGLEWCRKVGRQRMGGAVRGTVGPGVVQVVPG